MSNTIELNKENFTETVGSNKPVLVDYWAEWCGPCKMVAPILEEVASDMSDKLTVSSPIKHNEHSNVSFIQRWRGS